MRGPRQPEGAGGSAALLRPGSRDTRESVDLFRRSYQMAVFAGCCAFILPVIVGSGAALGPLETALAGVNYCYLWPLMFIPPILFIPIFGLGVLGFLVAFAVRSVNAGIRVSDERPVVFLWVVPLSLLVVPVLFYVVLMVPAFLYIVLATMGVFA